VLLDNSIFIVGFVLFVYRDVYALCVAHPEPFTNELYRETKAFMKTHVQGLRDDIEKYENNSSLLKVYHDVWIQYSQGVAYLNQLYS
jgi:cullin 2